MEKLLAAGTSRSKILAINPTCPHLCALLWSLFVLLFVTGIFMTWYFYLYLQVWVVHVLLKCIVTIYWQSGVPQNILLKPPKASPSIVPDPVGLCRHLNIIRTVSHCRSMEHLYQDLALFNSSNAWWSDLLTNRSYLCLVHMMTKSDEK